MTKRLFSILLICSLIGPYIGIQAYLKYEISLVRREIKHKIIEGLDRSELVELSFTPEEEKKLRWEHSKEFEYDGEMYDVVEVEVRNGKTFYWCWWDNEETTLSKQLNNLLAESFGKNGPFEESENLEDVIEVEYCSMHEFHFGDIFVQLESISVPALRRSVFDSYIAEIIPPPPKFLNV